MANLIKNRRPAADPWQLLEPAADGGQPVIPPHGDIIVPLVTWLEQRDTLLSRSGRLGVWLDSDEEPALLGDDLRLFGVVAVNFSQFTDGRGYSIARLLRERYGWRGELRAIGDVQRDQLFYLARCGFDAFALREGEDLQSALSAFGDFSEAYQASVERAQPLFRRRILASSDGMEWS
ncbi:MAG: DUF934 domain-containing protein [Pseudomonadota bacterium]